MIINKNKRKKGFTLIELIAVIAILAILGAILVPKALGYTHKADMGKVQADAKIVLNAVQAFNADSTNTPIATLDATAKTSIASYCDVPQYLITADLNITELTTIASGTGYTVTKSGSTYTVAVP